MSAFKQGFLSGAAKDGDPVADIFARPPSKKVKGDNDSAGKERFEISALPSRKNPQTNWSYSLVRDGDEDSLIINDAGRYYRWQVPKETRDLLEKGLGDQEFTARRLSDMDSHEMEGLSDKGQVLQKGRLQVHKSGPSHVYATLQNGKTNPTIDLSHGENNQWKFTPRVKPKKADPGKTLAEGAMKKSANVFKDVFQRHPDRTAADNAFYPIFTPPGGSHLLSAGLAGGIGAGLGLGYHALRERMAKADARALGMEYEPTGSGLRRALWGTLAGVGIGGAANIGLHATLPDRPRPALGSDPYKGFRAKIPGDKTVSDFASFPKKIVNPKDNFIGDINIDDNVAKTGSFDQLMNSQDVGISGMSVVSDMYLKKMVFGEPALTWGEKRRLMDEVQAAKMMTGGPAGISMQDVVGTGLGALSGYLLAKGTKAGPITTGVMSGIGALIGHTMNKDRGQPVGQPGFRIYS